MVDGKVKMITVKQLACENANATCQTAICLFRKKGGLTLAVALQEQAMPQLLAVIQQEKRNA